MKNEYRGRTLDLLQRCRQRIRVFNTVARGLQPAGSRSVGVQCHQRTYQCLADVDAERAEDDEPSDGRRRVHRAGPPDKSGGVGIVQVAVDGDERDDERKAE